MSELISRQEAIDAIEFEKVYMTVYENGEDKGNPLAQYNKGLDDAMKAIKALPSAGPEERTADVEYSEVEDSNICGNCGRTVYRSLHENYCPGCGSKLNWGDR